VKEFLVVSSAVRGTFGHALGRLICIAFSGEQSTSALHINNLKSHGGIPQQFMYWYPKTSNAYITVPRAWCLLATINQCTLILMCPLDIIMHAHPVTLKE